MLCRHQAKTVKQLFTGVKRILALEMGIVRGGAADGGGLHARIDRCSASPIVRPRRDAFGLRGALLQGYAARAQDRRHAAAKSLPLRRVNYT